MKRGRPRTRIATPEVSTSDVCEFFNVTRETVSQWTKNGMPKVATGAYNLKACFDWWNENINDANDDDTLTKAKRRYWLAKADEAETKVKQARDLLIPAADVVGEWCKRVVEVKQGLMSLPAKLPPILEGKTTREMRDLIHAEVYRLLDGYAREGRFCEAKPPKRSRKAEE